jgi:hypothetical protein
MDNLKLTATQYTKFSKIKDQRKHIGITMEDKCNSDSWKSMIGAGLLTLKTMILL